METPILEPGLAWPLKSPLRFCSVCGKSFDEGASPFSVLLSTYLEVVWLTRPNIPQKRHMSDTKSIVAAKP